MKYIIQILIIIISLINKTLQLNPANTVLELQGGVGISEQYYTNIFIGSEKQTPNLIINLQKSNIQVHCDSEKNTFNSEELEMQQNSQTNEYYLTLSMTKYLIKCTKEEQFPNIHCAYCTSNEQCGWVNQQGEIGYIIRDQIQIFSKSTYNFETYIVCQDKSNEQMGILGLNKYDEESMKESFVKSAEIQQFSVCLGIQNGYLGINRDLQSLNYPNAEKTEIGISYISNQIYGIKIYEFQLKNLPLQLNFNQLNQVGGAFILDLQTSNSIFQQNLYDAFISQFREICSIRGNCIGVKEDFNEQNEKQYDQCYYYDQINQIDMFFDSFPIIKIQLEGLNSINWKPSNYMIEVRKYLFCVGITLQKDKLIPNILGQNFFRQQEVIFDLNLNKLTIIESNCKDTTYGIGKDWQTPSSFRMMFQEKPELIVIFIIITLLICILLPVCYQKFSQNMEEENDDMQHIGQHQFEDESIDTKQLADSQYKNQVARLNHLAIEEKRVLTLPPIQEASKINYEQSSLQGGPNQNRLRFNKYGRQLQSQDGNIINAEDDLGTVNLPNATNRGQQLNNKTPDRHNIPKSARQGQEKKNSLNGISLNPFNMYKSQSHRLDVNPSNILFKEKQSQNIFLGDDPNDESQKPFNFKSPKNQEIGNEIEEQFESNRHKIRNNDYQQYIIQEELGNQSSLRENKSINIEESNLNQKNSEIPSIADIDTDKSGNDSNNSKSNQKSNEKQLPE